MPNYGKLDYPKLDIKMAWSTPVEQAFRLNACAKEPWTVSWIESMPPGSVLYDVGANVGSYTLLAAALGHTVVAIEPSFSNFARLNDNVLLNHLEHKVIALCMAATSPDGCGELLLIEETGKPGYSGSVAPYGLAMPEMHSYRVQVPQLPLVELPVLFGVPSPTHIKIDVDGGELDVLRGASTFDAQLMVEMKRGHEQSVETWMADHGYTLAQRFDHGARDTKKTGLTMDECWYGLWVRAP